MPSVWSAGILLQCGIRLVSHDIPNIFTMKVLITIVARDQSEVADERDSSVYMNCEFPGKPAFEERVRVGPRPRVSWMC